MDPLALNVQNYHSNESNNAYMSSHQWGNWLECPQRTAASNAGLWDSGEKEAFLVGGYIDCALLTPVDLPEWWSEHRQAMIEVGLLSKAKASHGDKLKKMIKADAMIERAKSDEFFMECLAGTPQLIITGELFGRPWRCMLDSIALDLLRLTDLKSTKSITGESFFSRDTIFNILDGDVDSKHNLWRGKYFDEFQYFRQFAVYREIAAQHTGTTPQEWTCLMASLSKENPVDVNPNLPEWRQVDLEVRLMDDEDAFEHELGLIEQFSEQVWKWKLGEHAAPGCGTCSFCIAHKKTKLIPTTSVVRY